MSHEYCEATLPIYMYGKLIGASMHFATCFLPESAYSGLSIDCGSHDRHSRGVKHRSGCRYCRRRVFGGYEYARTSKCGALNRLTICRHEVAGRLSRAGSVGFAESQKAQDLRQKWPPRRSPVFACAGLSTRPERSNYKVTELTRLSVLFL